MAIAPVGTEPEFPTISYEEVQNLEQHQVWLVDPRLPHQFAAAHIPGAVNIPIHSTFLSIRHTIRSISPQEKIVLYCNEEGCGWSHELANLLSHMGYRNLFIYEAGLIDWLERSKKATQ